MDYPEILDLSFVETPVDDFHLPSDDLLSNLSKKMKLKVFLRQVALKKHKQWNFDITRPNCDLDRRTILCLYVPGFQRQVFKHVKVLTKQSKESKEQKKNK